MKKLVLAICVGALVGVHPGCFDEIAEAPLSLPTEEIAAPEGLAAGVGNARVTLTWNAVVGASGYRIYRAADAPGSPVRLAEAAATGYVDADVQNGRSYYYSVSSLDADGLEGGRSPEILAVPSLYSVLINGGAAVTGSRTIALSLTAPETTAHMMIGEEESLAGGVWETFTPSRTWQLNDSDGIRVVFARFWDANGSLSPVVSDSVLLDRYAMITGIEITPAPRVYEPAATVHFALRVEDDETGGTASVAFSGYTVLVDLSDDGRGGDGTAEDGVYEADYRFLEGIRGVDLTVTGSFVDRVGNVAPPYECGEKISFTDRPDPVQLIGVADSTTTSITIKWVASEEDYFASYRIYRSTAPGITESPTRLVKELANPAQTSYPDGGLKEGVLYYYRIYVVNDLNETAGSNELRAHTFDALPDPVVLDDPSSVGGNRATLTWSENAATDFKEYRLYRSTAPGVTMTSTLVATIADREKTYYDDTGLDLTNTYYYRIYVIDLGGKNSRSNEVSTAGL